jgi:glycerophosphoryl diester phosphodiesterase
MVWIIAHRGASGNYPENTCLAFNEAINAKTDVIEFDVQITKDNKLVILHDRTLERTTNGYGSPQNFTLEELKNLDAGSWFNKKHSSEKIPTFQEAINCITSKTTSSKDVLMNIELKFYDPETDWFEDKIINQLKEHEEKVAYLAVKHLETFDRIKKLSNLPIALLQKKRTPEEVVELCDSFNFEFVQIRAKWVTEKFIQQIKEKGVEVTVYYSDDIEQAIEWKKIGVKGILTNYPELIQVNFKF